MGMRALEEMGAKRKQRGSFGTAHRIVYARGKAGSHGEEGTQQSLRRGPIWAKKIGLSMHTSGIDKASVTGL